MLSGGYRAIAMDKYADPVSFSWLTPDLWNDEELALTDDLAQLPRDQTVRHRDPDTPGMPDHDSQVGLKFPQQVGWDIDREAQFRFRRFLGAHRISPFMPLH